MKKFSLVFVPVFFLYCYALSQNFIIIRHIGLSDSYIPDLLIKNGEINQSLLDSNYHKKSYLVNIELDSNRFQTFKKILIKKKFLDKYVKNLAHGTYEILMVTWDKKETFYISNLKSRLFFEMVINDAKKNGFNGSDLVLHLEEIARKLY